MPLNLISPFLLVVYVCKYIRSGTVLIFFPPFDRLGIAKFIIASRCLIHAIVSFFFHLALSSFRCQMRNIRLYQKSIFMMTQFIGSMIFEYRILIYVMRFGPDGYFFSAFFSDALWRGVESESEQIHNTTYIHMILRN